MTERSETCATCRYYCQLTDSELADEIQFRPLSDATGVCRAHAPGVSNYADSKVNGDEYWCGEWRATKEAGGFAPVEEVKRFRNVGLAPDSPERVP